MSDTHLVWVEWRDAASLDAWTAADAMIEGQRKCITVGFLMRETEDELYVSGTRSEGEGCCTMIVPKACITRRETMLAPSLKQIDVEDLRHG